LSQIYVSLDIETTGLKAETDFIIEIGAIKFNLEGQVLDTWSTLVNPQAPIPPKIQRITGIKQLDVAGAPLLRDVSAKLYSFVQSSNIVGHNIQFDLGFLSRKGFGLANTRLDTFELASIVLPKMRSYSLEQLTKALEITSPAYHRALADATLTKDLFLALVARALDLDLETVQEINRLAAKVDWGLRDLFREIERQKAHFGLSGSIRQQLRAKGELDLLGRDSVEVEEHLEPVKNKIPLDVDALAAIVDEGGLLARRFPGYEHRPEQIQMLRAVAQAFNDDGHLMVEAGTGVGKSLSYLIPAAYFAATNGRRVVISTNTINLQDQLFGKDIPDLQAILSEGGVGAGDAPPLTFNAALVKGRSNYVCLRRWQYFRQRGDMSTDELRLAAKMLVWLPTSLSGERGELTITVPAENAAWGRVSAQSESCQPDKCEYFRRNQCYLYRARRNAESAHIVVVNHALLISDLATDNRVLPEYQHLIVDEAHHLEDVATDQLGFAANQRDVFSLLEEISSDAGAGRARDASPGGFLSTVPAHFLGSNVSKENQEAVQKQIGEIHARLQRARQTVYEFFNLLTALVNDSMEEADDGYAARNKGQKPAYDQPLRVTAGVRSSDSWNQVELSWENLAKRLGAVEDGLEKLTNGLSTLAGQKVADLDALQADLTGFVNRIRTLRGEGTAIVSEPDRHGIYWLTVAAQDGDVTLHTAPLNVGHLLSDQLFGKKECVVLTSATMATDGAFRYIRGRLGLDEAAELWVGSPFDYKANTLLFVPSDIPEPGKPGYQRALEQGLITLARATKGRMLVLLTSHTAVRSTYQAITGVLESEGIPVLGHGIDGQPRQLVERFKNTPQAVLMGTSSLWEGIDVVGDALSVVVIAKLPFAVPSDPVFAARSESFEDPFSEYAVPQTVLKFKQGFGRLIRSKTDRGVVAVLDRRVISKGYGKCFLDSLPECTEVKDRPLADLPRLAKDWLDGKGPGRGR
jgi:predicted DnaQ family exonuclease/DinG family helicase